MNTAKATSKDWTGNSKAVHTVNQRNKDAQEHDYYATEPKAVEFLLEHEQFLHYIWEPACGEGHISKVLEAHGHDVHSTDLIDRGYGTGGVDFLGVDESCGWEGDIITNPPYKYAREFVEKALSVAKDGRKVALFVKLTFLEGQARRELFRKNPPKQFMSVLQGWNAEKTAFSPEAEAPWPIAGLCGKKDI